MALRLQWERRLPWRLSYMALVWSRDRMPALCRSVWMERKTPKGHARIAEADPRGGQGFVPFEDSKLTLLPGDQLSTTCDFDSTTRTVSHVLMNVLTKRSSSAVSKLQENFQESEHCSSVVTQ